MKKTNFKRILSFFLAAVMLFGMLPAVFAQDADTKDVDYAITNPYATVDWKNYGQYKASLHNHSIVSDGDNDFRYVIETYYSMTEAGQSRTMFPRSSSRSDSDARTASRSRRD